MMTTIVQIADDETVEITSVLKKTVRGWVTPEGYNNVFTVTVKSGEITESFDYHISIHDTERGKKVLDDNDHIGAFYSFLGDAIAGSMDFEEFMDEFGYTDCRKGHKIYKACENALNQADSLNLGNLYRVSNYIIKKYPDAV